MEITTSIATDDLTISLPSLSLSVTLDNAWGDIFGWDSRKVQGQDAQLFVYLIDNNGTDEVGVAPTPRLTTVATNYRDGSGQAGTAGFTNMVMSGTRDATNSCEVVGRINVRQNDDNTWQTPTTSLVIDRPIYETDELVWTPNLNTNNARLSTYNTAVYTIRDNKCSFVFRVTSSNMGNVSGASAITLPCTPKHASVPFPSMVYNGSAWKWAVCWSASAGISFWKDGNTAWAANETGLQVYITGEFEIA